MNSDLTSLGRAQAAEQGVLLKDIFKQNPQAKIICSPQGRARQTAEIALAGFDVPINYDPRIAELGAGIWTGLSHEKIAAQWPTLFNDDLTIFEASLNAVDGEGYDHLKQRCLAFLNSLTGVTIIITHGITGMVLRGLLCHLSYDEMAQLPFTQGCIFAMKDGKETILSH